MICEKCGTENEDNAKYCNDCGATLNSSSKTENKKTSNSKLIIAITVIICACIVVGALFLVDGNNSNDSVANSTNSLENDSSNINSDNSSNEYRYADFDKSSWNQPTYTLEEIYTAHTPDDVKAEMFNQADSDGNGVLTGDEIKEMDYLLKHSEYTWTGPGMGIHEGTINTGSGADDKTFCSVYVGKVSAGENVKISVLYSYNGKNLNQGNIVQKTVDKDGYVIVSTAEALDQYPDKAFITLYDNNGNIIDSKTVYLSSESGSQPI